MMRLYKIRFWIVLASAVLLFPGGDNADPTSQGPSWKPAFDKAMKLYEQNKIPESVDAFAEAAALVYGQTPLNKSPQQLRELFDTESMEGRARCELARWYKSKGDLKSAARLYCDCMLLAESQAAHYLGVKEGCKSCHYKQWKSWKDTKMAKALDVLKPGAASDVKKKFNLDPKKDYSEDPNCLQCHTTGWGMPGGYVIPAGQNYKVRKQSEQTQSVTCEACHGPGSKYGPVHKDVDDHARAYKSEEFFAVGEYQTGEQICLRCHNSRSPTTGPDYKFDYEQRKKDGTHKKYELKYRIEPASKDK